MRVEASAYCVHVTHLLIVNALSLETLHTYSAKPHEDVAALHGYSLHLPSELAFG